MKSYVGPDMQNYSAIQRSEFIRRKLASMSVPATERILYQCPSDTSMVVDHVVFTSTHSGSETISLWHVGAGESTANSNALYFEYSLSAKATLSEDGPIYMNPGERLVVKAGNASRITITVYGIRS